MKYEIECCDLCHAPITREKHGVVITLGFSIGGFGRRQDHANWSGELCPKCNDEYTKIANAVTHWLDIRNESRIPTITVTEYSVHVENQPKPLT